LQEREGKDNTMHRYWVPQKHAKLELTQQTTMRTTERVNETTIFEQE